MPESFKKSQGVSGQWILERGRQRGAGRHGRPAVPEVGHERDGPGANPAIAMFAASHAFARLLHILGTEDQKRLAPHIIENGWHCTMVLTEPDAGSDVGAGRTRATQNEDGTWNITGVKRFITSGESDMVDNVVHFVLAPVPRAGAGTKGGSRSSSSRSSTSTRDRRTRRAQRCRGDQRREEDGPEGLHDLRAHLRRESARRRHPARRCPRRHRPDVPGHRARPHARRDQGHRDPLQRLPQRPRVRQAAGPGARTRPRPPTRTRPA